MDGHETADGNGQVVRPMWMVEMYDLFVNRVVSLWDTLDELL